MYATEQIKNRFSCQDKSASRSLLTLAIRLLFHLYSSCEQFEKGKWRKANAWNIQTNPELCIHPNVRLLLHSEWWWHAPSERRANLLNYWKLIPHWKIAALNKLADAFRGNIPATYLRWINIMLTKLTLLTGSILRATGLIRA